MNEIEDDEISLLDYINVILKRRWLIVICVLIAVTVSVVISLRMASVYTAKAKVYIGVTDVDNLKDKFTGTYMGSDIQSFYIDTCRSESFLKRIIEKKFQTSNRNEHMKLVDLFVIKSNDRFEIEDSLYELLKGIVKVSVNKGVMTFAVSTYDPVLSSDISNAFANELIVFSRDFNLAAVTKKKAFVEDRLKNAKERLNVAEDKLRKFSKKNRQILELPGIEMEKRGLAREVKLQEELFISLNKEYELTKVEESKIIAPITIHEEARPPKFRSKPKRKQNVLIGGGVGLILALFFAFILEYFRKMDRSKPEVKEFEENINNISREIFFLRWFLKKRTNNQ